MPALHNNKSFIHLTKPESWETILFDSLMSMEPVGYNFNHKKLGFLDEASTADDLDRPPLELGPMRNSVDGPLNASEPKPGRKTSCKLGLCSLIRHALNRVVSNVAILAIVTAVDSAGGWHKLEHLYSLMKRRIHFSLLAWLLCLTCPARADLVTVWLDELDLSQMKQEVLRPKAKRSFSGEIMSIGGMKFARGIGSHANSSLTLDLQGKAQRLIASVGVDEGKKSHPGSVEFLAIGDGKTLWKSGVMKGGEPARRVDVDLAGVRMLELRATDGGDGVDSDHADWADARILAREALPHLYPDGADAMIPTEEWNKLSRNNWRAAINWRPSRRESGGCGWGSRRNSRRSIFARSQPGPTNLPRWPQAHVCPSRSLPSASRQPGAAACWNCHCKRTSGSMVWG